MLHYLSVQTTTEGFSAWGAPSDTKHIQTQAYDPSGMNNAKRVTATLLSLLRRLLFRFRKRMTAGIPRLSQKQAEKIVTRHKRTRRSTGRSLEDRRFANLKRASGFNWLQPSALYWR